LFPAALAPDVQQAEEEDTDQEGDAGAARDRGLLQDRVPRAGVGAVQVFELAPLPHKAVRALAIVERTVADVDFETGGTVETVVFLVHGRTGLRLECVGPPSGRRRTPGPRIGPR